MALKLKGTVINIQIGEIAVRTGMGRGAGTGGEGGPACRAKKLQRKKIYGQNYYKKKKKAARREESLKKFVHTDVLKRQTRI